METCSKCGKKMGLPDGSFSTAALHMEISWDRSTPEEAGLIKANLGKYAPIMSDETSVEFNFCYECWLDSLMEVRQMPDAVARLSYPFPQVFGQP